MSALDPISLQVLAGRLKSICDEMGAVLIRSAHSPNIKERRDCSTALFDPGGELVMQAEHIPVHLGSMPDAVAAVVGEQQRAGRSWILNDPFAGGTHLPDITLVTPVIGAGSADPVAFVASRAHHADVGGPTPGSMPAHSRRLADEGVVIAPRAVDVLDDLDDLIAQMREPTQRRADLQAQLAANETGCVRLLELVTGDEVLAGMAEILDYAERRTRARLAELPDGSWEAADVLEGGAEGGDDIPLEVRATVAGDELELDFTGSAGQVDGNLNCPLPVTRSAALFAVRALLDPDAPASAGAYRPVRVVAPEGSILNARPPAAVAAGNVETSSRVADLVLAALGGAMDVPAQGQGTMNNLTLAAGGQGRDGGFTYYETLGGGQGACPRADGPSAIHVAMSNTLNTPVEALETEFPVRVREVSLRPGSGGAGVHRGGDGVVRELRVLEPCRLSLLSQRRRVAPAGAAGGGDGQRGRNLLNGEELPPFASRELAPGDLLRVETPGGGGYGST